MIKKLSQKDFLETFKFVPRVAVNLLIKNNKGEILLTKRAIPPLKGYWHIPGSFLIKNERLKDCIKRVASKELRINVDPANAKLLRVFEDINNDPRGHIIDIIYGYKVNRVELIPTDESKDIRFFATLPERVGFNHKDYLLHISKHWVS